MSGVRLTSVLTYNDIVDEGLVGDRQQMVYEAFRKYSGSSDSEITRLLGFSDNNAVRPRRCELVDMGLIYEGEKRKCSVTGRLVMTWYGKEATERWRGIGAHPKDELGDDGFVYRDIVSKSRLECTVKCIQYGRQFVDKRFELTLLFDVFEKGVHHARFRRRV